MIRLGESAGLGALPLAGRSPHGGQPGATRSASGAFAADLLVPVNGIGSDLSPASRGLSVAQHAANVLSHLCRDGD